MKYRIVAFAALITLAGFAHADTRATQQRSLEKFTPYLQQPVEDFDYWSLYKWQLVGPEKIIVWTTIKDAYLLTVETPCPRLEWAHGLSLTSKQSHRIAKHFDFVAVGHDRCRIEEIQPVDTRRMDAERKAAK
jgi:hypothetical protein